MLNFFRKRKALTKVTNCDECSNAVCVCRDCQGLKGSCFNVMAAPCVHINGYNCGGYVDATTIK